MLTARGLTKVYAAGKRRVEAVVDVSLDVAAGEFLAICGRSGSGKSTLLAMLAGLCRPTAGRVSAGGEIGMLFQFSGLLPTLRAIDNVALPALLRDGDGLEAVYRRAAELLTRVGLADRAEAYPAELSGGEQRRVALARSLIHDPPVLLADEPTSDLDAETEAEIVRLLLDVRAATGKALVVVTHNPDIAALADRMLRLDRGRVVSESAPEPAGFSRRSFPDRREKPAGSETAPATTSPPPTLLGSGAGRFVLDFALWVGVIALAVAGFNHAAARFQQSRLEERKSDRERLEQAALRQLRADVENIAAGPDGSFLLTVYLQNVAPEEELYVTAPSLRAFVQVERDWVEVPLEPADDQAGRVVALTDRRPFRFRFTPRLTRFEELLPGYMHVRLSNTMLIRPGRDAQAAPFERVDDYYIYLKPHGADDAAILKRLKFPGKPPLWIPMPPH
ncbi:MAG: ABC transporter ATP-binding protein [Gemmataceae bacterium]